MSLMFMQRQKANEPDVVEFVSALAAGNNAQLMVVACSGAADYTTLALVAAAQQTGGRVVCILCGNEELHMSEKVLGVTNLCHIDFVIGEAQSLVLNYYKEADFVVIDCNLENHEGILRAVQMGEKQNGAVVVGTNAFAKRSWRSSGAKTQLLPIGGGLPMMKSMFSGSGFHKGKGFKHRLTLITWFCLGEDLILLSDQKKFIVLDISSSLWIL